MIKLMNMRVTKPTKQYDIRVDRASILGNPFVLDNENDRNDVCNKYDAYFLKKIKNNNINFISELNRIVRMHNYHGKVRLFCWCTPKRCHADIIKKWLENEIKKCS